MKIRDNPHIRASNWDKLKVRKLSESAPAHPRGLWVCSQLVTESTIMQSPLYKQIPAYYGRTGGIYFCHRFGRMCYPCDLQPGHSKSAALAAAVGGSSSARRVPGPFAGPPGIGSRAEGTRGCACGYSGSCELWRCHVKQRAHKCMSNRTSD